MTGLGKGAGEDEVPPFVPCKPYSQYKIRLAAPECAVAAGNDDDDGVRPETLDEQTGPVHANGSLSSPGERGPGEGASRPKPATSNARTADLSTSSVRHPGTGAGSHPAGVSA